jgi:hypothetical protein
LFFWRGSCDKEKAKTITRPSQLQSKIERETLLQLQRDKAFIFDLDLGVVFDLSQDAEIWHAQTSKANAQIFPTDR